MMKSTKIQVRFADCDMMGHVNNAVYLSYFEHTRMDHFSQLVGIDWDYQKQGMLLVKNEVVYLKPIFLYDIPEISLHLVEIGDKSFTCGYEVKVKGEVRTTGASKIVCFDFVNKTSVKVFPEFIEAFKKLEKTI